MTIITDLKSCKSFAPAELSCIRTRLKCLQPNLARATLRSKAIGEWPPRTTIKVLIQCFAYLENSGPTSQYNALSCFTRLTLVQSKLCPHWLLGSLVLVLFGVVLGFGFVVVFGSLFFRVAPLTNMQSFHPSHDDLGTPPTRRPYSWKKHVSRTHKLTAYLHGANRYSTSCCH